MYKDPLLVKSATREATKPDKSKQGSISPSFFVLSINVKIEKAIAVKRASMLPHISPFCRDPKNIIKIPENAAIIVHIVILLNFSPRKINARRAVRNGIRLIVKTVLATVVLVIDIMKQILDVARIKPANHP